MTTPAATMTPDRWQRVDAVLQGALERPAEQRAAWLVEACAGDDELRREVESLLGAVAVDDFLERPAAGVPAPRPDTMVALATALGGRYELERELGRGGMATVYRARDARHRRAVAVKVLHPELTATLGPERFLREITVMASLQHPHLLPLFDSGAAEGLLYYVMPLVEGETLRERLGREGQLPVDEALRLTREVADALAYAHARGVVHRDIKPDNILLQSGHALVADFGVALAVEQAAGDRLTRTGLSVGTPQYMAPEQATGERAVDARADVYALGAVLYEMLAGEPPFTGASARAIVTKVMADAPRAITQLRHTVPPHVESALRTALEKVPADRFPTAAAFAAALETPSATPAAPETPASTSPPASTAAPRRWLAPRHLGALLGAGALAAAVLGWVAGQRWRERAGDAALAASGTGAPVRFAIDVDSGSLGAGGPVIAPDGRTVVFTVERADGTQLWARRLDELDARPIPGTDGGERPFLSPDGAWVGFFADGVLRRVRLDGSSGEVLAKLGGPGASGGATWGAGDTIWYAVPWSDAVYRVVPGGARERVRLVDVTGAVTEPRLLPGGRALLVTVRERGGRASIGVLDLASGRVRVLGRGTGARYAGGQILFTVNGELHRQGFDTTRLALVGDAQRVMGGLAVLSDGAAFDVASDGALVYRAGGAGDGDQLTLAITDRRGRAIRTIPARNPWTPRFSPDGRRVAYGAYAPGSQEFDLWIADLATGATQRVTSDANNNNDAQWSRDGASVAYSANAPGDGGKDLFIRSADGTGARPLLQRPGFQFTTDWLRDGSAVLFVDVAGSDAVGGNQDVWAQPIDGGPARPVAATPVHERAARASPDGRWIAYVSDETGREEVWVQSYPNPSNHVRISLNGGVDPAWRGDGRELYYWEGEQLVAVRVEPGTGGAPLVLRERTRLFRAGYSGGILAMYDVSADGERFVLAARRTVPNRLVVAVDAIPPARR